VIDDELRTASAAPAARNGPPHASVGNGGAMDREWIEGDLKKAAGML
jgi:hypothetical protein